MSFLAPQVPNIPAPPPAPPPAPDVNQVKNDIAQQESLSRKPKGKQANLLTGVNGDTSSMGGGQKTLLG